MRVKNRPAEWLHEGENRQSVMAVGGLSEERDLGRRWRGYNASLFRKNGLFAHWEIIGLKPTVVAEDRSRMSREIHVRFWGEREGEDPSRYSTATGGGWEGAHIARSLF
jgi:hypothetical protein